MQGFTGYLEERTAGAIVMALLFLAVAGAALYYNTFQNKFVYDDTAFVVNNQNIRTLGPITKYFDPDSSSSDKMMSRDLWRPLTTLSYALTYSLFGLNPGAFHAIGVMIHIMNTLLIFWLVFLMADPRGSRSSSIMIAFIASLTFLIHPVQSESVAWVSQRSNVLFLLFYALALISYIYHRSYSGKNERTLFGVSLLFFVLSLLSKEMALSLPFVIFAYECILGQKDLKESITRSLPYFAVAAVFVLIRSIFLGKTAQTVYWAGGFIPQMLTMVKGFAIYVKLLFIPYPLSVEYLFRAKQSVDPEVLASGILLAGLIYLGFRLRKSQPMISFGIFLFFLSLLPVSNIIPVRFIINERFLYLAVVGFGMILGQGAIELQRLFRLSSLVLAVGLILLFAVYSIITFERNLTWRDQNSFVTANIRTCPQSAQLHFGQGQVYASKMMFEKAASEFEFALSIDPMNEDILKDLGVKAPGADADAIIKQYRRSIQKRVDLFDGLHSLGVAYFNMGAYKRSVKILEKACSIKPDDMDAMDNLANAYAYAGNLEKAIGLCVDILQKDPLMARARYDLATFYDAAGMPEAAKKQREIAGKMGAAKSVNK